MAQLIVRNLEDDVRDKLRAMAEAHGRSMEEEVREILREAALRATFDAGVGLGTRVAERFREYGLEAEDIEELRGQPARPADLEP
jgi:plasmid stability protein